MSVRAFARRSAESELLDEETQSREELARTFDELDTINRWLGGYAPSLAGITRLLPPGCRRFSLLDVGTGGGDLLRHVAAWAERRGIAAELTGLDRSALTIDIARERWERAAPAASASMAPSFECRDLFALDGEGRYDIVHAALTLHHLDDTTAAAALACMARLARRGVVVNDLHRHPLAYWSIRGLTAMLSGSRLIRHDAPVSVLRAFRRAELLALVRQAGLPRASLHWRWAFRWALVIPQP